MMVVVGGGSDGSEKSKKGRQKVGGSYGLCERVRTFIDLALFDIMILRVSLVSRGLKLRCPAARGTKGRNPSSSLLQVAPALLSLYRRRLYAIDPVI